MPLPAPLDVLARLAPAWPWLLVPPALLWRARDSGSLDDEPAAPPADAPAVDVVVPARNEARNIARCLRAVLAADWPRVRVLVVDDHSTDGTGDLARAIAAADPRVCVLEAPALPAGWFGKQWACTAGADAGDAELLLFVDADTAPAPDLLPRAVAALRRRDAVLLSVVGRQELGTFWERLVQPLVLATLASRYGGTERVTRSLRVTDKIANGQCLLVTRAAFARAGGFAAVRDCVSDDLRLAQAVFAGGGRVALVLGTRQLATRMYTSLGELVRGWRKNMYAGGVASAPFGAAGRLAFPLMLLFPPAMLLLPPLLVAAALLRLAPADTGTWATVALVSLTGWLTEVYRRAGARRRYALAYPLGAAVLLWIVVQAIARGRRVEWKGRALVSG